MKTDVFNNEQLIWPVWLIREFSVLLLYRVV